MLDFTSSLYLGFWHDTGSLRPWEQLTTGRPAALAEPPAAGQVAQHLARLQGCECAILGPSTLHLCWDMFGMLAGDSVAMYVDASAYPIARWGIAQAAVQGVPVYRFPHHNTAVLQRMIAQAPRLQPVVVTDGICTGCGHLSPLAAYLRVIRPYDGLLVLDDTQALGIYGHTPAPEAPYGHGGGGSLQYSDVRGSDIVVVSSLAKGFGVPMAVLSGSWTLVERFTATSQTRVHCSPPNAAAIHAAAHALQVNITHGDHLRRQLAQRVRFFHSQVQAVGLAVFGGLFPVQTVRPSGNVQARDVHRQLLAAGIRTVLRGSHNTHGARLSFILTARHGADEIAQAAEALAWVIQATPPPLVAHG